MQPVYLLRRFKEEIQSAVRVFRWDLKSVRCDRDSYLLEWLSQWLRMDGRRYIRWERFALEGKFYH